MAIQHHFNGPANVYFGQADATAYSSNESNLPYLGFNRENIPVTIEPKFLDVPCDDYGGPDGEPSDFQVMPSRAMIQLNLTKFEMDRVIPLLTGLPEPNPTVAATEPAGTNYVTGGTYPFGTFVRQGWNGAGTVNADNLSGTLVIEGNTFKYSFDECLVVGGNGIDQGTRYSTCSLVIRGVMNKADLVLFAKAAAD